MAGSVKTDPVAMTRTGMSPIRNTAMSKSWIIMSLKIPPERRMYSAGGAPGSREVMTPISGVPIRPSLMAAFTPMKCGSKRRLNPTISVAPVSSTTSRQARTRAESRSIGFSQNTALPARENSSICSA